MGAGLGECERERPEPGADLDHSVAGPDPGEGRDAADRVGVGDEVLAEVSAGSERRRLEEFSNRRTRVRH